MFQGGRAKLRFQEIRGREPGIQLFSMIYAILIDIRLDEFPRGGECEALFCFGPLVDDQESEAELNLRAECR